jgi:hypothetical protein
VAVDQGAEVPRLERARRRVAALEMRLQHAIADLAKLRNRLSIIE